MSQDMRLNYDLFEISNEIEQIDSMIARLQMRKEELLERREQIKKDLEYIEITETDMVSQNIKQKMVMNMLGEKLGGF